MSSPKKTDSKDVPYYRTPEFMRSIAAKGGNATAKSKKAVRPFSDPKFASKAGSITGYKFNRKKSENG